MSHSRSPLLRVEQACTELIEAGQVVTFTAVAQKAHLGRATLYRDPQLHAVIEEHRNRLAEARTLTGLQTEIAHLRTALEAIAANTKNHEERLRRLERSKN